MTAQIRTSRTRTYALWAALLSQGSPLGALALGIARDGRSAWEHLAGQPGLYLYMSVATLVAFTSFGAILGRFTDTLLRERGALRDVNRRLRWLSDIDALTGVLNRRALCRRLRVEIKRVQRNDSPLALLMLDLDHFKRVNDELGHLAGDRALRRVGRLLRRLARATDIVGRFGGEEFLVALPGVGIREALSSAERLRAAIAQDPSDGATPRVTASIGVVVSPPHRLDMESRLRAADGALYQAKASGRNCVRLSPLSQESGVHLPQAAAVDVGFRTWR